MKNYEQFAFRSFFCVFFLCLSLPFSKTILTGEIVEILNEQLSDGNLAYTQIQYIINELNLEPKCSDISKLFKYLKISIPEIQKLIHSHCHQTKKTKLSGNKLKNQGKYLRLSLSYQDKIQPKSNQNGGNLTSVKAEFSPIEIKYQKKSNSKISSFRSLKFKGSQVEIEAGDLYLKNRLSFVNGRNFWPGHSSLVENRGAFFTSSNRYNGIQSNIQYRNLKINGYGIWNKNRQDINDIDAVLIGTSTRYHFHFASLTSQTQLNSLDKLIGPDEKFLINGILLKGKPENEFSLGFGHSLYQPSLGSSSEKNYSGYYGEAGYSIHKEKTSLHIFQSSSTWKNPLMDINKKYSDTTEYGSKLRGSGEGGIEFQSNIPLSSQQFNSGLNLRSKVHWFKKNTELKYRQHSLSFSTDWESLKHNFKIQTTTTDSTDFLSINPRLNFKYGSFLPGISYSHKLGDYKGEYSRSLTMKIQIMGNESSFKIKTKWKNIIDKQDDIILYFYQRWNSNKFHIENSIYMPLKNLRIAEDLYYKIMFTSNLSL